MPRPPTLNFPNRLNGDEQATMLGVSLRITITLDGSEGMSLEVMVVYDSSVDEAGIVRDW